MELLSILICSSIFFIFLHAYSLLHRRNLPPGPKGIPIFGSLFAIGDKPHETFSKLSKKYGPLMSIRLGGVTSIVASSPEMAREILQKNDEAFSGRVVPSAITKLEHSSYAVVWLSTNDQWRTLRKVLATYLTNTQKLDTLRDLRHKVVQEMVQHLKEVSGKGEAADIVKLGFATAVNQISNTCFSVNVADYKTQDVKGFQNAVKSVMEVDIKFNVADYFPLLRALDPQGLRGKAKDAYGYLEQLCDKFIVERLKQRQSKAQKHGDLLDCFLDFSQENESEFSLKHVQVLLVELFLAGTETTANTVEWALTELLLHPQTMAKLRKEVIDSVKANGKIEEGAVMGLPYLQAVVKETMRLHLLVPFLVPRRAEKDVKLKGYTIPKDTQILVNAWGIARDPEYWENSTSFIPERFLNSEVDVKGQDFSLLPFGSGRRMCAGIALGQRVVSLMIASLVYHFDWELPNGMSWEVDTSERFALSLQKAKPLLAIPKILNA
ncbi:hypothetical protein DCAR_0207639 [Daucus carota subsp. sativus]|uniref:Cytochrome P450 n=1 Tax=Daucus carota subsp. sativus TaxID=79200 RepID=A0AAF0WFW2_DAUCS|nr:hypothetical protein DCAR_0207639 [Daucus carota subsp. sativus]